MATPDSSNPAHRSSPSGGAAKFVVLPQLSTAEEIAKPLGVHPRTIHSWGADGTIPVALRHGRIVRFSPMAVGEALGLEPKIFDTPPSEGGHATSERSS